MFEWTLGAGRASVRCVHCDPSLATEANVTVHCSHLEGLLSRKGSRSRLCVVPGDVGPERGASRRDVQRSRALVCLFFNT